MKIRNGFVSNSSSSSFVVTIKEPKIIGVDKGRLISVELEKELLEKGFVPITTISPIKLLHIFEFQNKYPIDNKRNWFYCLGHYVTCSQDDIIDWLVERKIPFKAACHYGHETVIYNGKGEPKTFQNKGLHIEMYGENNED